MWGSFTKISVINGKPCWFYRIGGDASLIDEISRNQPGVISHKGRVHYRLRKFHGPLVEITKKVIDGSSRFIPVRSNGLPESESTIHRIDFSFLASKLSNKYMFEHESEKYHPDIDYGYNPLTIKLRQVAFNDWEKLLVIARLFANFTDKAIFVKLRIKWQEKEFNLDGYSFLTWILNQDIAFISSGAKDYLNFLEQEYHLSELFLKNTDLRDELYPYNKIEFTDYTNAGWITYIKPETSKNWSIEYIEAPTCLIPYIEQGFKSYAIQQEIAYSSWMSEQMDGTVSSDFDSREMIRDGFDDLNQSDPEWHWNID
jgi:hypothetical protein